MDVMNKMEEEAMLRVLMTNKITSVTYPHLIAKVNSHWTAVGKDISLYLAARVNEFSGLSP